MLHLSIVTGLSKTAFWPCSGKCDRHRSSDPMGFGDWRISTALITGFMAKESVVSTLSVLFGNTATLLVLYYTALSSKPSGVLSSVYTMCGSDRFY